MTSPTTILDIEAVDIEAVAARAPTRWRSLRGSLPFARGRRAAERNAEWCLSLFLVAALPPDSPGSHSIAAALFAEGAFEATADRAELGRAARARLERALHRAIGGAPGRAAAGWRRTLAELGKTPRGQLLRRGGEEALRAWLRGDPPGPRFAALVGSSAAALPRA